MESKERIHRVEQQPLKLVVSQLKAKRFSKDWS